MDLVDQIGVLHMKIYLKCAFGIEMWKDRVDYVEGGQTT